MHLGQSPLMGTMAAEIAFGQQTRSGGSRHSPTTAQGSSPDPLPFELSPSYYAYVGGNPTSRADFSGKRTMAACCCCFDTVGDWEKDLEIYHGKRCGAW